MLSADPPDGSQNAWYFNARQRRQFEAADDRRYRPISFRDLQNASISSTGTEAAVASV
jgi:hypothetical protein